MIKSTLDALLLTTAAVMAAACGPRPEQALIARAGLPNVSLECAAISNTRTTVCRTLLDSSAVAKLTTALSLRPLDRDAVANLQSLLASPTVQASCRLGLTDPSSPGVQIRGVFGQPHALFEPAGAIQYEHLILLGTAKSPEACLFFEFAYG
jgi:hypothetical protein